MLKVVVICQRCGDHLPAVVTESDEITEHISLVHQYDHVVTATVTPCAKCNNNAWTGGYRAGQKSEREP